MHSSRRSSARLLSLLVATSLTSSARFAQADPEPGPGKLAALLNQPLGEDQANVSQGSQGQDVRRAQEILNKDRSAHGLPAIAEDSDFGPETEDAVRAFQKAHDISQTGTIGPQTWAALDAVANPPPPAPSIPFTTVIPFEAADHTAVIAPTVPQRGTAQAVETLTAARDGAAPADATATAATPPGAALPHAPVKLSAASLDALARIIEAEAGVCSLEGRIAVGAVVLNRVRAGYADKTVIGVIKEDGQFSGYDDADYRAKPSADSIVAAKRAAAGEDPSNGAEYYYNPYLVNPSWAKTMKQTARIGTGKTNTHRFMKP